MPVSLRSAAEWGLSDPFIAWQCGGQACLSAPVSIDPPEAVRTDPPDEEGEATKELLFKGIGISRPAFGWVNFRRQVGQFLTGADRLATPAAWCLPGTVPTKGALAVPARSPKGEDWCPRVI